MYTYIHASDEKGEGWVEHAHGKIDWEDGLRDASRRVGAHLDDTGHSDFISKQ